MNASPQGRKNIRIFESDFFEQFSYVHPAMPIALWGPLVAYWFATGLIAHTVTLKMSLVLAGSGFAFWTLSEYMLHRFLFHFNAETPFEKRVAFLIHGIHHDDPMDDRRLLMPPVAAAVLAVLFYFGYAAILGFTNVKPFFAGFIVGYLCYDYTHFAIHFMNWDSKVFKKLKHNHMLHHFVKHDKRFGVSNTLWDHVFGTHK